MLIDLTDHLRCPEPHREAFLVLLPDRMEGRDVVTGTLGCPLCGREYPVVDGVADFGPSGLPEAAPGSLGGPGALALLGLDGPGGFVALVGGSGSLAAELGALLPGVHLVLVDPPDGAATAGFASVVLAPALPLKQSSMRGVVLGPDAGASLDWVGAGVDAVLPGNRVVGEGPAPDRSDVELLGQAGEVWVVRKVAARPVR